MPYLVVGARNSHESKGVCSGGLRVVPTVYKSTVESVQRLWQPCLAWDAYSLCGRTTPSEHARLLQQAGLYDRDYEQGLRFAMIRTAFLSPTAELF